MIPASARLAVSNLAWPVAEDELVAAVLRQHGATGVELAPGKVWSVAPAVPGNVAGEYAATWRAQGLSVVAFQAILFGHPEMSLFAEGVTLRATQDHLVAMGALAAATGAGVLVLGAPGNRRRETRTFDEAIRLAADALRPVVSALESHAVRLCIEPNPPQYGCDFVTTAAEALVLAETVGHPNFGIHLDAAALAISGEITVETLRPLMRHVRHFHISEVDLAPVGTTTTVPHAAIGRALRDVGYGGWCSIEMRTTPDDPWQAALPRALAVARAHYTG